MNIVAHVAVAALVGEGLGAVGSAGRGPAVELLAGSALPDVASMGRVRLRRRPPDGTTLAVGVALHHRTDDLFHRHPWFTALSGQLSTTLAGKGLGRGPARAIGHVGVELLLDGRLLAEPDQRALAEAALGWLSPPPGEVVDLVADDHRARWRHHLEWVAAHRPSADAHDPGAVARRLQRILAHRPRLTFPADDVPLVTEVLAARRDEIDDRAPTLVAELAAAIIDGPTEWRRAAGPAERPA